MRSALEEQGNHVKSIGRSVGLIILFVIYFLHAFPEYLAGNVKYAGMALLSILFMFVLFCLCFEDTALRIARYAASDRDRLGKRVSVLIMIVLASIPHLNQILLDHRMYLQASVVTLPLNKANLLIWALMTGVSLVLLVRVPRSYTPIYLIAILWGVVLRLLVLHDVTFNPAAADMLYCIDRSCDSLLHGVNPYSQTYSISPVHSFPLVYAPLLWLPYLPLKLMSLDIRWFNLLAQLVLVFFVLGLVGPNNRSAVRALFPVVLMVLPDMIWTFFYRQVSHYWLLGVLYVWLLSRERWNASLIAVSGLVAMRLTSVCTAWIFLIYVWKRKGLRAAILNGLVVAASFVLFLAPFSGVGVGRLKYVLFGRLVEVSSELDWRNALSALSLGATLKAVGLAKLLMPLQACGLMLLGLGYRLSPNQSYTMCVRVTVLSYAYFLWSSAYVMIYYWFMPIIMLAALYLIESSRPQSGKSDLGDGK